MLPRSSPRLDRHAPEEPPQIVGQLPGARVTSGRILLEGLVDDVDDALRAGVITENDLPAAAVSVMGRSRSERIDTLVCDILDSSWDARGEGLTSKRIEPIIGVSPSVNEAMNALRDFLFERVYDSEFVNREAGVARLVVRRLYEHFMGHEDQLPGELKLPDEPLARRVVDYVAGMTDQYALQVAKDLGLVA